MRARQIGEIIQEGDVYQTVPVPRFLIGAIVVINDLIYTEDQMRKLNDGEIIRAGDYVGPGIPVNKECIGLAVASGKTFYRDEVWRPLRPGELIQRGDRLDVVYVPDKLVGKPGDASISRLCIEPGYYLVDGWKVIYFDGADEWQWGGSRRCLSTMPRVTYIPYGNMCKELEALREG